MNRIVYPGCLRGSVSAIPSKSAAHRALICAALARGESLIENCGDSDDISATVSCLQAMGADITKTSKGFRVMGIETLPSKAELCCRESGSTLRFLLPVCAALGLDCTFTGKGRLPFRPLDSITELLTENGAALSHPLDQWLPLTVSGKLEGEHFSIDGSVSSQYLTGLLLAAPLMGHDVKISLTSPLQSKPYVDLTLSILRQFGITVKETENGYQIPGGQQFHPAVVLVEGDYSNAAVFLCAGALNGAVTVTGLAADSVQGDRKITSLLCRMGGLVQTEKDRVTVLRAPLRAIEIDAADIPDLVPILAVTAALSKGTTTIFHAERLIYKESNRLLATCQMLSALGADCTLSPDGLQIRGKETLSGGCVSGYRDHRMVMAASAAALQCKDPVIILGTEAVEKSYPHFFEDFKRLGGKTDVLDVGNESEAVRLW